VKSISSLIGAAAALIVGWFFLQMLGTGGLPQLGNLQLPGANGPYTTGYGGSLPPPSGGQTIRIGSFNIQDFGEKKVSHPDVMNILARIVRQFDVLAIQEVSSRNYDVVRQLVDLANRDGSNFDYLLGPRVGRGNQKEQYAFIFDRASIEVDANQTFTVDDPYDNVAREPLVGWFRVRGPQPNEAFTFALVNIHTDPDDVANEVDSLAVAWRAIRSNDWQEDDVLVLGDLNANDRHLGQLGAIPGMMAAISNLPTNTRGNAQYDNIIFQQPATQEFTGRAGVLDFVREFELSLNDALLISDHLPVWAEFSVFEGGQRGRYAARDQYGY
jgi:endonuclease/exonuclease/phosphatase family metal-dependent hydrolase